MKKIFAIILTMVMLLPMVFSMGSVASAADYTAKPFYGMGWSDINRIKFPNLEGLTIVGLKIVDEENGVLGLSYAGKTDPKEIAASIKKVLDRNPEGMRHLFLAGTAQAFYVAPEDAIFMENGVGQMKALFTELINEYKRLGGQLDSLVLDTEYTWMGNWYLYSKFYGPLYTPTNPTIYKDIVENPKYATMIRPLLVERGFVFFDNPNGNRSEIGSAFPYRYLSTFLGTKDVAKYANSASIWDSVMSIHLARYLNDALLEPLLACYPNAIMSDYQEDEVDAWQKSLSDTGGIRGYYGGNSVTVGNASNYNTYASRPSGTFYKDGNTYVYKNLPAFNNAVYEDDPYHMFLYDANKFKQMYASSDYKRITAWLAEYDYGDRAGSVANTPYYTETIYHIGMLNPDSFLLYIYAGDAKFKGENGTAEYNKRMQTVSEILYELTRVAGFSDRKPIETPAYWNDGYVLSGMYAGGRNIWRITPDTTEGTSVEAFKVKDNVPTFSINGTTITFPQGKILADSTISVVGSAGYWVETPANVTPVVTRDADRYSKNPSFMEAFSDYAEGSVFNSANARPHQTWEVTASENLLVQNGALALTGTATVNNVTLPKNITAGDSYARQQAWEVSFTMPTAMNAGANVKLLACGTDGGIKLEDGKVYYDQNGSYQELSGVILAAGQKYTVKREVNFAADGTNTCTYSIYDAKGNLLKEAANIPMKSVTLPVSTISISCSGLTTKVMIDDYKLYPTGLATDFELYNGDSGIRLDITEKSDLKSVAYRLSWLNGTNETKAYSVKAAYYNNSGALVSDEVIRTVVMAPGCDCVETGIVENTSGGKVLVYLAEGGTVDAPSVDGPTTPTTTPTIPAGNPDDPADDPVDTPTDDPTTDPTTGPSGEPGGSVEDPTENPTTQPSNPAGDIEGTSPSEPAGDGNEGNKSDKEVKNKSNTGTIVLIVAIVAVVGGAAGVLFWMKKKKSN